MASTSTVHSEFGVYSDRLIAVPCEQLHKSAVYRRNLLLPRMKSVTINKRRLRFAENGAFGAFT